LAPCLPSWSKSPHLLKTPLEISKSVAWLQEILGHKVKYFAYPNGIPQIDFSNREYEYLKSCDISLAFSTESSYVSASNHKYSLPRIAISHGSISYIRLKLFLGKWFKYLQSLRHPSEFSTRKLIYKKVRKLIFRLTKLNSGFQVSKTAHNKT
tara:strand:- start:247 stop:705 length:459 start_codon:yes stop_codon:yes gene_type:complete